MSSALEISEIVKNWAQGVAVLGASAGALVWYFQRKDRSADMLFKLNELFHTPDILAGRKLIEDHALLRANQDFKPQEWPALDAVLRFYTLLHGVNLARQIDVQILSPCFRYWLGFASIHNSQHDAKLRKYVDTHFNALSGWLTRDDASRREASFFYSG
jgi:hypothetical protein